MQKAFIKVLIIFSSLYLAACSSTSPSNNTITVSEPQPTQAQTNITNHHQTSSNPTTAPAEQPTLHEIKLGNEEAHGALLGGSIEKMMDENDKIKMSRSLDKAPGKATDWTNERTGIKYTVLPTKKVVINGNPYCREYETIASKGDHTRQANGTACISSDGNWHTVK